MPAYIFKWLIGQALRRPREVAPGTLHVYDENGFIAPNPARGQISPEEAQWYWDQNEYRRQYLVDERRRMNDFLERTVPGYGLPPPLPIPMECNREWQSAKAPAPRDPLAIDLDGDGIETTPILVNGTPTLFDHDADGVKTGTGWLRPDDGWLAWDRDGNGTIDTGRELFGVDTLITSQVRDALGSSSTVSWNARSGFEALQWLDLGNGTPGSAGYWDGVFDSRDAQFANVRVWRDLNGDGVSQSAELQTLAQVGISSISLNATPLNVDLGNGNSVTATAAVTLSGGRTATVSGVNLSAGNLQLGSNPFYRQFTDTIPLTLAAVGLPTMGGSGWLRDLREAVSLQSAAGSSLQATLQGFASETTAVQQRTSIHTVLQRWADTSGRSNPWPPADAAVNVWGAYIPVWGTKVGESATSVTWRYETTAGQVFAPPGGSYVDVRFQSSRYYRTDPSSTSGGLLLTDEGKQILNRMWVLEAFNGQRFVDFEITVGKGGGGAGSGGGGGSGSVGPIWTRVGTITLTDAIVDNLNRSYAALVESVYGPLVLQTRLATYLEAVELVIEPSSIRFDATALQNKVNAAYVLDPSRAVGDLVELVRYANPTLQTIGYEGLSTLRGWYESWPAGSPLVAVAEAAGLRYFTDTAPVAGAGVLLGNASNNSISGSAGTDVIDGGGGDDSISAGDGDDSLFGRVGSDVLRGGAGNDSLDGGAGNDVLAGGAYDTWNGNYNGAGSDTYYFGRGDGQDAIWDSDTTPGVTDQLVFKAGVLPADVQLTRSGDHLIARIANTTDQVQITNYFGGDGTNGWQVEQITFTDAPATVWTVNDVKLRVLTGEAGNDTIIGYASDDVLRGMAGNDSLSGRAGNDTLEGGAGADTLLGEDGNDTLRGEADADTLQGGNGNDTLDGGTGNDILAGGVYDTWNGNYTGTGADTYLFGRGDGQDAIWDRDTTAGVNDRLVFKAGVLPADVQLTRSGDHLIARIANTTDQVQITNYFGGDGTNGWQVEQITFTDAPATVWTVNDVKLRVLTGEAGNDTIIGYASDDVLRGMAGNDSLSGRAGNDTLEGGAGADTLLGEDGNDTLRGEADADTLQGGNGNDTLDGGTGNDILAGGVYDTWNGNYTGTGADTYLFGRGDGQDAIWDRDTTAGVNDRLVFKAGVLPADVQLTRSGDHLIARIANTTDQVQITNYFGGDGTNGWQVEQITFTDAPATVWTVNDVKLRVLTGEAGNDTIIGYASDDVLRGMAGNDSLSGRAGNDTLEGGAGADTLLGEDGNDTLRGEADADTLQGGNGNDTLDGGTGNDILAGGVYDTWNGNYTGTGADTYLFGRGDGQDAIWDRDTTAGVNDRLVFKAGVLPADVQLTRSGDHLIARIANTTDQVQITNYFGGDGTNGWQVEQITFTDAPATVWTVNDVKLRVLTGEAGNDTIIGYASDDVLRGMAGNDSLSGRAGNDTLEGGAGADTLLGEDGNDTLRGEADADTLQGGNGNDTLDGGTGNDILAGGVYDTWNGNYTGTGADTYLFGRGDGQDAIWDRDTTAGVNDRLVFKAGVLPADVQLTRSGDHLIARIANTTDQVQITNYFGGDGTNGWQVEQITFTDAPATVWTVNDVKLRVLTGEAGNDTIIGYASDDVLRGMAGNDSLSGRAGNDTLEGGAGADTLLGEDGNDTLRGEADADTLQGGNGNDTLDGGTGNDILAGGVYDTWNGNYNGAGNDIYRFGRGDGQDAVWDNDATAGNFDVVSLKAGVLPTDVSLTRAAGSNHLVLSIAGTTDRLTITNYFTAASWTIEQIQFEGGGAPWDQAAINARVNAPAGTLSAGSTASTTQAAHQLVNAMARFDSESAVSLRPTMVNQQWRLGEYMLPV